MMKILYTVRGGVTVVNNHILYAIVGVADDRIMHVLLILRWVSSGIRIRVFAAIKTAGRTGCRPAVLMAPSFRDGRQHRITGFADVFAAHLFLK